MHNMNKPTVTAFGSCTVFVAKQGTSSLHSAVCKMMNFTFLRFLLSSLLSIHNSLFCLLSSLLFTVKGASETDKKTRNKSSTQGSEASPGRLFEIFKVHVDTWQM